jgi:hypothetical protein
MRSGSAIHSSPTGARFFRARVTRRKVPDVAEIAIHLLSDVRIESS